MRPAVFSRRPRARPSGVPLECLAVSFLPGFCFSRGLLSSRARLAAGVMLDCAWYTVVGEVEEFAYTVEVGVLGK